MYSTGEWLTNRWKHCSRNSRYRKTQQPIHIHTISNAIGIVKILDISQIKGHSTNRLKPEHLEKQLQKVKDKLIMSVIVDADNNRHSAHVCVVWLLNYWKGDSGNYWTAAITHNSSRLKNIMMEFLCIINWSSSIKLMIMIWSTISQVKTSSAWIWIWWKLS